MTNHRRGIARELAAAAIGRGSPLEWFNELYHLADGDASIVPWADMVVNPNLTGWLERAVVEAAGQRALVIGCGLGDDAEMLRKVGFDVTAFDLSTACIEWCRRRFPESAVDYTVADLLELPSGWLRRFDFVLEAYTLQVLPVEMRARAIDQIEACTAPGGRLLVIARGRDAVDETGEMPWPLLRSELQRFVERGLSERMFEDYMDEEEPPVRRFRVEYVRESR